MQSIKTIFSKFSCSWNYSFNPSWPKKIIFCYHLSPKLYDFLSFVEHKRRNVEEYIFYPKMGHYKLCGWLLWCFLCHFGACITNNVCYTVWAGVASIFYKVSPFMSHKKKKVIQVWNDMSKLLCTIPLSRLSICDVCAVHKNNLSFIYFPRNVDFCLWTESHRFLQSTGTEIVLRLK